MLEQVHGLIGCVPPLDSNGKALARNPTGKLPPYLVFPFRRLEVQSWPLLLLNTSGHSGVFFDAIGGEEFIALEGLFTRGKAILITGLKEENFIGIL